MTDDHQPMRVTAYLAAGIAHAAPWGIALDGLLAAELWAQRKSQLQHQHQPTPGLFEQTDPPDLELPLATCRTAEGLWHWAATCAYPLHRPDLPPQVHTWTGRTDPRSLEQLSCTLPAVLSDRQGPYRGRRMPLLVTTCAAVSWYAVGDPTAVQALLGTISAIGKKRSSGEGHVLRWQVTPLPTLDRWQASHLHPDGTLGRPTPTGCLTGRTVTAGGYGTAGLRPPYMHPARQHQLHLPTCLDT